MRTDPLTKGLFQGIGAVILVAGCLALGLKDLAQPSPALLRDIASLGGALVLAYVVQMSWLVRTVRRDDEYENLVGVATGLGVGGLLGVFMALLIAAHREAGHANVLDTLGASWAFASLIMLGSLVIIQPFLVSRLSSDDSHQLE
jgi:uncharacterized membrane protein YdjX (TVP38/TMEM64 family)